MAYIGRGLVAEAIFSLVVLIRLPSEGFQLAALEALVLNLPYERMAVT